MSGGRGSDHQAAARAREGASAGGRNGRPLATPSMPFTFSRDAYIAAMAGPPAWAVRLKRIHDARTELATRLESAWGAYARRYQTNEEFAARWCAYLSALDLSPLNTLIRKHNEYYPIEARLPIVWPTGEYRVPTGVEYPQQPVTVERLLEDYPPDRDMALYFTERA